MAPSDSNDSQFTSATEYGLSDAEYKHDDILGGRYRVISFLGKGGMGVVYRVEQIFLGKELALKTIDRHLMSDITIRRFKAEARAAFAVDHPNIVSVHDFGLFEDQTPFMVMEIVQGETLGDRLKRGTLSVEAAIPIYIQICFGLAHAHASGIVHRDIKPNNIMLLTNLPEGIETGVKILDFGIAKITQREGGEIQALTRTGDIFGSPLYMSPEQCAGGKVDHRADVYSLGCVIFESLTGTPPFVGENALATMMMHQTAVIPTLKEASLGAEFPPELERLVALMLAKNPDERYQDLGNAAHDLAALKRGEQSQLSAAIQPRGPSTQDTRVALLEFDRSNFYSAMIGLSIAAFLVSSGITFVSQPAITLDFNQVDASTPQATLTEPPAPEAASGTKIGTSGKSGLSAGTGVSSESGSVTELKRSTTIGALASTTPAVEAGANKPSAKSDSESTANDDTIVFDLAIKRGATEFQARFPSDATMQAFKNYPAIQSLSLRDGLVSDDSMATLKNSKILLLNLYKCTIESADNISKLSYLQTLDLSGTKITDSDIPKLANLRMLQALSLTGCEISENGLKQLIPAPSLKILYLTPARYSVKTIDELYEKMPQCRLVPYKPASKFEDLQKKIRYKDRATKNEKLIAAIEKTNKNCAILGTLKTELATDRFKQKRFQESRALIDSAATLLDRLGAFSSMVNALITQAHWAAIDNDKKRAVELNDRAERIFLDTTFHAKNKNLLTVIDSFTRLPIQFKSYDKAIEYCQTAIDLIDRNQVPEQNMLPIFLEKIGTLYQLSNKFDLSRPYLKRAVDVTALTKDRDSKPYLRALIEYSHSLGADKKQRAALYEEAINALDRLNVPEDLNLRIHYCDACDNESAILASEQNHTGAILYARKGLAVAEKMKEPEQAHRKVMFRTRIAEQLKASGHDAEAKQETIKAGVKF